MERRGKTIVAMRGRPLTPKRTEYGKTIRGAYERGEINEKRSNIQRLEPRTDGICNTITTVQKDNLILGKVVKMEKISKKLIQEMKEDNFNAEVEIAISENPPTIEDYLYTAKDGEQYGIFKLSPRECLRLMDVKDEDIDKMAAVNSNTQLYKQAGNSVVVSCWCAILSQLNIQGIKPWNDRTDAEKRELLARGNT